MKTQYIPYNDIEVEKEKYWDYSIMIKGIVYEMSINQKTGKLYINKDNHQPNKY